MGADKLNATWFVKRALEFTGRYMVTNGLLNEYYARGRGTGSEGACVAAGGDCLMVYGLEAGRHERWERLLPCAAAPLSPGARVRALLRARIPTR